MLLKPALFLFFLLCILLCTCADNNNPTYPFERSVLDISIVKNSNDTNYIIKWRHPIEKIDLQSYYIWIDTTVVKDTAQNVSQAQIDAASAMVPYNGEREGGDSLVLTELISGFMDRDSLHIAIWAKYGGSSQGAVQHLYAFFGDDFAPSIVNFSDSSSANTIWINWVRPTDQRDFYHPDSLSGPIAGYNITLSPSNASEDISYASLDVKLNGKEVNANIIRFHRFRKEGRTVVLEDLKSDSRTLRIAVIDGKGFDTSDPQANNWSLQISNLKSESSYNISITAWDSTGNSSKAAENRLIPTTDDIAPLIANKFWFYADSGDGLPRLDSNRLILFWPKSVDPLTKPTQIELDSTLRFPASCAFCRYNEIQKYSVEQWNGASWENVPRLDSVRSDYYNARYRVENGSMVADGINGTFVSDTLRWVAPGDSIMLRIRAIDNSGHYSAAWISTIIVSKGALWETQCPPGYMPVKNASSVFCMEKLQHATGNNFLKNVLYREAKETCENLKNADGFKNFSVSLCTEQEWNAACASRGSVYGVIEEKNSAYSENDFSPSKFLFKYCGVRTGNSSSAYSVDKRNKLCISPDGIRDLPGQLQEWVTEKRVIKDSINGKDTIIDIPLLKGTSYALFEGASGVELAQCRNRFTPTRIRPKYTTDTLYVYRNGSRRDTLLAPDTLRTEIPSILLPDSTLLFYTLKDSAGVYLGEDYVKQAEYRRRGGDKWLEVYWQGLVYEPKDTLQVLILGTESINASGFFLDPTVGFRCCANVKN